MIKHEDDSALVDDVLVNKTNPESENRKKKIDLYVALSVAAVIMVVSIILIIVDLKTLEFSSDMRILGPGAFPLFIFIILIILDLMFIAGLLSGKGGSSKLGSHIEWTKVKKALRLHLLIVVCVFLMTYIGFVLSMMILTFVEMKYFSEKKLTIRTIVISTLLLPLIIYTIFVLLNVPLPSVEWIPYI